MNAGRPVAAASDSMNSGLARGPVAMTKMPRRFSPSTPASVRSSSSLAIVDGIGRPPQPLWFGEKDDAKPMAPASTASATSARMRRSSASVGVLRTEASSPITALRMVEC